MGSRVTTSQSLTVASFDPPADARVPPSGENDTERIHPVCPSKLPTRVRVPTSHSLTVRQDPEARRAPSEENDTAATSFVCPSRTVIWPWIAASHSLMVPSLEPEAKIIPSRENAMDEEDSCPESPAAFLDSRSRSSTRPSTAPEARVAPSSENATEWTGPVCSSRIRIGSRVATCHSRTVGSCPPPAEARVPPSGEENATERTSLRCPLSVATSVCVAASHNRTVGSSQPPPEARSLPSGENDTEATRPVCPSKVACSVWVATSHNRTVPSWNPETSLDPSGEKARESLQRASVSRGTSQMPASRRASTSHTLMTWSSDPEAKVLPSREKATEETLPQSLCRSVPTRTPVSTSHNSTWPFSTPAARMPPTENATEWTDLSLGSRAKAREVEASYSHTPMALATARQRPSAERATARSLCPRAPLPRRTVAARGKCQVR